MNMTQTTDALGTNGIIGIRILSTDQALPTQDAFLLPLVSIVTGCRLPAETRSGLLLSSRASAGNPSVELWPGPVLLHLDQATCP